MIALSEAEYTYMSLMSCISVRDGMERALLQRAFALFLLPGVLYAYPELFRSKRQFS